MKKLILSLLAFCLLSLPACAERPLTLPAEYRDATRKLTVALGGDAPAAEDFLTDEARAFCAREGIGVTFREAPDFSVPGDGSVMLCLSRDGSAPGTLPVRFYVCEDVTPPTLTGAVDRAVFAGEGVVLYTGVVATDDCFGTPEITVDTTALDTRTPGYYPVIYRATDASGNTVSKTVTVAVYPFALTDADVDRAVTDLLAKLTRPGDSPEQICRAVYDYVTATVEYDPFSDKTDATRAAYLALFVEKRGDCFSFASAARLLLERAGVPALQIERTPGVRDDTHFWLMVNIAPAGEAARWYYFDATPLRPSDYDHSGCLLTEAQLAAYNTANPNFYAHDATSHPPAATEVITPTPNLGIE